MEELETGKKEGKLGGLAEAACSVQTVIQGFTGSANIQSVYLQAKTPVTLLMWFIVTTCKGKMISCMDCMDFPFLHQH